MRLQSYPGAILFLIFLAAQPSLVRADEREDFFESKIRPILIDTCFRCHGGIKTSGGLRLDSREALLKGGDSGPSLVIGKPEESLLIRAIRRHADISAMPPEKEKALKSEQITYFEKWVKEGANWPSKSAKFLAAKHWSFEPVRDWPPPRISNDSLKQNSIDAFLHSRQIKSGLKAAKPADKLILIRRATLDLTGLPPTPAEIDIFLKDTSPGAYASLIERLLKSPAYGERWGRHWLDIVRYADTAGDTADYPVPQAWRYRNYVIDSFNADKPYDQFLREQIAGDILANQGPREKYAEQVIATGYLAISRRFGFDSENYQYLTIQDTIDTLGQSILGLSLGCARCHDHKFDAISMKDYYGLYAIFDSSRYAFPGSEQKQRNSLMVPLEPPAESQLKWREFQRQVAQLSRELSREKQSLPVSIQHSLHEMDGDFEMQAPAAGGSNGVLVPPWLYEGKIAVTNAAQSPFQNLYPSGKAGISISSGAEAYSVKQALYPIYTDSNSSHLYVNLDFRVGNGDLPAKGMHRFRLDSIGSVPVFEILISADALSLKSGASIERLGAIQPNQWYNLQLDLDLKNRKISGRYGFPGSTSEFKEKSISQEWMGRIESVELDSVNQQQKHPAIDYDNIGVQLSPIPAFSEKPPAANNDKKLDRVSIAEQLQAIAGIDGDFESQANDQPPIAPWNAGPNSVVKLSVNSQSPFENLYEKGQLGIHMPNRGEYDGFGQALPKLSPNPQGLLYLGFDFRCESQAAGGNGSWRYYIGHGPGQSAAVELFFNGEKFFRRSGDAREAVGSLVCGQWYQLQLTLDLKLKSYRGSLTSHTGRVTFEGQFATGWDGTLDHTFIDSYGHIGGVRPSLDADNFVIQHKPLPAFDGPPAKANPLERNRRAQIMELRAQLLRLEADKRVFSKKLIEGPFEMTYGVVEGTPHNVAIQLRGEPDKPGEMVPRSLIRSLGGNALPPNIVGSGRLELANWLTRADNPLTARVIVNRIWQHHFGRGLVKTPNDFGVRGLPPTHPELLDHLASHFMKNGWSIKEMHRLIMLSSAYQQSSIPDSSESSTRKNLDISDLYISFPRRRMSAEEIRDSILAVSGELDRTPAKEHPFPSPAQWGYSQHSPFSAVYEHDKRSIYLMTQRLKRHPFLALFDGADPNATTADRQTTTVPTQSLFFLNDPFVHAKAQKWASRLQLSSPDPLRQIELAWIQAIGRTPSEQERSEALGFLNAYRTELKNAKLDNVEQRSLAAYLRTLLGSNEFLHVD